MEAGAEKSREEVNRSGSQPALNPNISQVALGFDRLVTNAGGRDIYVAESFSLPYL